MIFPYKIAVKILKNLIFSQTNDKFDENSTSSTFKYRIHEIQNKIVKSLSKIKKLGSFFDFHTKRPNEIGGGQKFGGYAASLITPPTLAARIFRLAALKALIKR